MNHHPELCLRDDVEKKTAMKIGAARAEIDRMILLAEGLVDSDPEQAVCMAEQAAEACRMKPFEKKAYLKGLAKSYHASASIFLNQGKFGQALKFHSDSLSIYREIDDREKIASQLNNVGIVFAYCGDYAEALKFMRAAESYLDQRSQLQLKSEILNNIGYTYVALADPANAIPILQSSLKIAQKIRRDGTLNHFITQSNVYDSLCQAFLAQNNLSAALQAGLKSTALSHQSSDLKKEAEYLLILGDVYSRMENLPQADDHYQQALTLARAHGFRREEAEAYRKLGILQCHQGQYTLAKKLIEDALALASEIKIQREVYECHQAMAMLYKATAEFEKALVHYERFHQIKETVFNDQSDQRIKNLETLHQVQQSRREAEIQQQKNIELQKEIVERKKAHKLAEILASTDSLTGIYNRRHFMHLAKRFIAEAIQAQTPLGVIILDIDHFKQVNDQFGHQEGDRTLSAVARKIGAMLRSADILGRIGGEEFAIALPNSNGEQSMTIAERLRSAVEALRISPASPDLKVTISLGIASLEVCPQIDADLLLDKLLERADQAMYAAKRQGRNRVCAYPD